MSAPAWELQAAQPFLPSPPAPSLRGTGRLPFLFCSAVSILAPKLLQGRFPFPDPLQRGLVLLQGPKGRKSGMRRWQQSLRFE